MTDWKKDLNYLREFEQDFETHAADRIEELIEAQAGEIEVLTRDRYAYMNAFGEACERLHPCVSALEMAHIRNEIFLKANGGSK